MRRSFLPGVVAACLLTACLMLVAPGRLLAAEPPLAIPLETTRAASEQWPVIGTPQISALADTSGTGWLAAWSYGPVPGVPVVTNEGRIVARIVKARNGSEVVPPATDGFPPVLISSQRALDNRLSVVRGRDGGWVVWKATTGIMAQWVSAITGLAVGPPITLTAASQGVATLRTASDGPTAWVGWIDPSSPLQLSGASLASQAGPPRVLGRFVVPLPEFVASVDFAARSGNLLVTVASPHTGVTAAATTRLFDSEGRQLHGPFTHDGPFTTGLDGFANVHGTISYGRGWMVIWAQRLNAVLPARVFYGLRLAADGSTAPGTSLQALFVEPAGSGPWTSVTSVDGVAALFAIGGNHVPFGSYVVHLREGGTPRYRPLPANGGSASTGAFDGSTPALLVTRGNTYPYFTHHLAAYDGATFAESTAIVSRGATPQQEPSLAFVPGACLVGWQEGSGAQQFSDVLVQTFRTAGAGPSDTVRLPPLDPDLYSSPSIAALGRRVLVVARKNIVRLGDTVSPDAPDDVVGVLLEDGQVLKGPFLIAGGPGSQRAARVVACGEGFCVAWREELFDESRRIRSQIRCAFFSRDGAALDPEGITLASEAEAELAAPAMAARGDVAGIVWRKSPIGSLSSVHGTTRTFGSSSEEPVTQIFGEETRARSPDIIADDQGFSVAARLYTGTKSTRVGVARFQPSGAVSAVTTIGTGREPVMAPLASGDMAVFWLDDVNDSDSTQISMTVRQANGTFSEPSVIRRGRFDRDTLVAHGDGRGRVLLAVQSLDFTKEGILVLLVAPGVQGVPEIIDLTQTTGAPPGTPPGLRFQWNPNILFPASLSTVESSTDLRTWAPVPAGSGEVRSQESGPATFSTLAPLPSPERIAPFFRLRALLAD